ncbi:MAG: hypothetical protein ABEJ79_01075 [Halolamina sp.]
MTDDDPVDDGADAGADSEDDTRINPDAPLGDLTEELAGDATDDPAVGTGEDDPFEPVDVDEVNESSVWEDVVEGDDTETAPDTGLGPAADARTRSDGVTEHVVDKREYCQRCPHFSEPPRALCTHEGTTIAEVVDADHFRVRDCPVAMEGEFGPRESESGSGSTSRES